MKLQPVAQGKTPQQVVFADGPFVYHLRLDLTVQIGAKQRVINHVAMVTGDKGRSPDRV